MMTSMMKGMKWERLFLIAFLGNYIINNIVAGIASLIPAGASGSFFTAQYIAYVILAAIVVGLLTWWYFKPLSRMNALKSGALFGVCGFIISILTTLVSGIAGVLAQSGSLAQVWSVLPNFGPFLWNWSTLILVCFWVIPATFVGWWIQMKAAKMMTPPPSPMGGQTM
jgi:hypothetical protein